MQPDAAAPTRFKVIQARRVYAQIAEQIALLIRTAELKPGDRLPAERDLAKQFGVSRPSVREAMIALEAAGLVQVRPGEGIFVQDRPAQAASIAQAAAPSWFEQLEACSLIEPEVAALAARSAEPGHIADLAAAVARMSVADPDGEIAADARHQFHLVLAQASGNSFMAKTVKELWDLRRGAMWEGIRKRRHDPARHRLANGLRGEIVTALADKDPAGARRAMKRLCQEIRSRYFSD
jgi:DNA-binding FadR family transcriptional regulator